jgi:hypothetical protein
MRVWARALLPAWALAVALGPGCPTVSAAIVAYNFSGGIISISPLAQAKTGVVVNDTITGSFAYDSALPGSNGVYTYTGKTNVHSMTFKIFDSKNAQVFTDNYTGNVSAYYAIKVQYNISNPNYVGLGTQMDIMGDTLYKQGLGMTGPNPPAFDLTLFNVGNKGTTSANKLPDATLIKNFDLNRAFFTWDPPDQTFTAQIRLFQGPLPEPSGLVLGTFGIATSALGFLMFGRKRPGQRRRGRRSQLPAA